MSVESSKKEQDLIHWVSVNVTTLFSFFLSPFLFPSLLWPIRPLLCLVQWIFSIATPHVNPYHILPMGETVVVKALTEGVRWVCVIVSSTEGKKRCESERSTNLVAIFTVSLSAKPSVMLCLGLRRRERRTVFSRAFFRLVLSVILTLAFDQESTDAFNSLIRIVLWIWERSKKQCSSWSSFRKDSFSHPQSCV